MNFNRHITKLTRRSFLKITGVATSALAVPGIPTALASTHPGALKIGVLLPSATVYPQLGSSLLTGMQTAFDQNASVNFVIEDVGAGYSSTAYRLSEKLLTADRVDLVVGWLSSHVAATLSELYASHHTVLVACNAGENVIRPDERAAYVRHNTLGLWQSHWALGHWAAENLGSHGFSAMSLYDSGFDAPYLFRLGFEAAGGTLTAPFVSHVMPDNNRLDDLIAAIQTAQPDFVYAAYCGDQMADFTQAYAQAGLNSQIPLVGSPFAARHHATPARWEIRPSSDLMASLFKNHQGHQPPQNALTALGYSTGQLAQTLTQQGDDTLSADRLILGAQPVNYPTVATTQAVEQQVIHSSPKSGWLTPYLCM